MMASILPSTLRLKNLVSVAGSFLLVQVITVTFLISFLAPTSLVATSTYFTSVEVTVPSSTSMAVVFPTLTPTQEPLPASTMGPFTTSGPSRPGLEPGLSFYADLLVVVAVELGG